MLPDDKEVRPDGEGRADKEPEAHQGSSSLEVYGAQTSCPAALLDRVIAQ